MKKLYMSIYIILLFIGSVYIVKLGLDKITQKNIIAFNNSEELICYDTLIITNSNWGLVGNHLINNNSAGYLDIRNCEVRK
jgi:hypothetical protein